MIYNIVPPRPSQDLEKNLSYHVSVLQELNPSMVGIYDLIDEKGRNGEPRPFPFVPTMSNLEFGLLLSSKIPGISILFYYAIKPQDTLESILSTVQSFHPICQHWIFIGCSTMGISLKELIYQIKLTQPHTQIGSVLLPARPLESLRMRDRQLLGIDFFLSQIVVSDEPTLSVLQEYQTLCLDLGSPTLSVWLTFCPLSHQKSLKMLSWLGVDTNEVDLETHEEKCHEMIVRFKKNFSFVDVCLESISFVPSKTLLSFFHKIYFFDL